MNCLAVFLIIELPSFFHFHFEEAMLSRISRQAPERRKLYPVVLPFLSSERKAFILLHQGLLCIKQCTRTTAGEARNLYKREGII